MGEDWVKRLVVGVGGWSTSVTFTFRMEVWVRVAGLGGGQGSCNHLRGGAEAHLTAKTTSYNPPWAVYSQFINVVNSQDQTCDK